MRILISTYITIGRFKTDPTDGLWSQLHFGEVMHYHDLDESGIALNKQKTKPNF